MNHPNQSYKIKKAIKEFLEEGDVKDKQEIYTKVVEKLDVPRPTVRRVARDLRNELVAQIKILQSETHSSIPSAKTE